MVDQIRRMRLPTGTLTWEPIHDGIIGSYCAEMAMIHGVEIENETNMIAFEGQIDVPEEARGASMIGQIGAKTDEHLSIRLHSHDKAEEHPTFKRLQGKRVRVTVEIIE